MCLSIYILISLWKGMTESYDKCKIKSLRIFQTILQNSCSIFCFYQQYENSSLTILLRTSWSFFVGDWGLNSRLQCLLHRLSHTSRYVSEMGSCEIFARAGLELRSS
jgi:hypothetical protein